MCHFPGKRDIFDPVKCAKAANQPVSQQIKLTTDKYEQLSIEENEKYCLLSTLCEIKIHVIFVCPCE